MYHGLLSLLHVHCCICMSHVWALQVVERSLQVLLPGKEVDIHSMVLGETLVVTPYNQFMYRVTSLRPDASVDDLMTNDGSVPPVGKSVRASPGDTKARTYRSYHK